MKPEILNLDDLRLPGGFYMAVSSKRNLRVLKPTTGKFLRGPVPWSWVSKVMPLPGRALQVGIMLWFLHGLTRLSEVKLNLSKFKDVGIGRDAASRGLKELEEAGLVEVTRCKGCCPRVRILEVEQGIGHAVEE